VNVHAIRPDGVGVMRFMLDVTYNKRREKKWNREKCRTLNREKRKYMEKNPFFLSCSGGSLLQKTY